MGSFFGKMFGQAAAEIVSDQQDRALQTTEGMQRQELRAQEIKDEQDENANKARRAIDAGGDRKRLRKRTTKSNRNRQAKPGSSDKA